MIAGYITAVTTDLARVAVHGGRPHLVNHRSFTNADFTNFDSILSLYLRKYKADRDIACFGVAGPVIDNKVTATNIPWKITGRGIAKEYDFKEVRIMNDLVATAHGLFELDDDKFIVINQGKKVKNGNIGLLAPGVGLGEALVFWDGGKYCPYASEGGHVDFSPGNQLETELWEYVYSNQGYVEAEDIISLPGLGHIYEFMLATERATKADWYKKAKHEEAKLIEKALAGEDSIAEKALDMFVDCCASEAGNLALKGMTLGGIYLGGPIAPQIMTALDKGRFMERFAKKGKMESLLSNVPVSLIIDEKTALLGAARIVAGAVV
ncbi:MAG: glucokinase [Candidatus Zixiibacteriota bacterium]